MVNDYKYYCRWSIGSTNKETGKREPPHKCKKKNCTGIFNSMKELSECEDSDFLKSVRSIGNG